MCPKSNFWQSIDWDNVKKRGGQHYRESRELQQALVIIKEVDFPLQPPESHIGESSASLITDGAPIFDSIW